MPTDGPSVIEPRLRGHPPAFVPVVPESAPFTAEQRAWLNGFLAGLFSYAPGPTPAATESTPPPLAPLRIAFGSQTGSAEKLAKRAARMAGERGFCPVVSELAGISVEQLAAETNLLVITSTYGDGEPPDNARAFWESLRSAQVPRLERLRFSVCALGDTNYPRYCQFGKDLDARLETLGALRGHPRQDCDVEYERSFAAWLSAALAAFESDRGGQGILSPGAGPQQQDSTSKAEAPSPGWSRERPCPAQLVANRRLSAPGSSKDVRHLELAVGEGTLAYETGDALGVWPENCPDLIREMLAALGDDGSLLVPGRDDESVPLGVALQRHYELTRVPLALLRYLAERTRDPGLLRLVSPEANGELTSFLTGRDVLDLMLAHWRHLPPALEFVSLLRKLQPRLYSISSSPSAHPGQVHLTVSAVRYAAHGRERKGLASCFLADRCRPERAVPVFIHSNPAFRPPPPDVPLIMIGPGTGIAPFRAFLEERRATGARGRNWLFFGDQHASSDYLYREELEAFLSQGVLTRLDLAWSRDQAEKVYVQTRMIESAAEMWRWLEQGAAIYVCGDATRMAKDVDASLRRVIEGAGGKSPDAARAYVAQLQADRRYLRDVY